ncbi:MAG: cell envelope integrity protein TolA, partial [Thiohalospira sp.]
RRAEEEARRQEELKAEEERLDQQREAQLDRERNRYIARIEAKVTRSWRPPEGAGRLAAVARVRVNREGRVLSVEVMESSGNPSFDSSLERAVLRASPLPVPDDDELFERNFREFNMKFSPRDM